VKLGLSVLLLILLGVIYLQWRDWPPTPEWGSVSHRGESKPAAQASAPAPDLLAQLDAREDKGAYLEVVERPLFQPERRPSEEETSAETASGPTEERGLEGLDLNAVILTSDVTMAWVFDGPNSSLIKVRPGDDLAGWTVREIRADRLVLERHGEADTLPLQTYSTPRASPGPQPGAQSRRSAPRRVSNSRNPQQRRNVPRRQRSEP